MDEQIRPAHPHATPCSKCGTLIVFFPTPKGGKAPIDESSTLPTDGPNDYDPKKRDGTGRHVSHFATCPHAASFRRGR